MRKWSFRGESCSLDAEARSAAPGEFVELPDGMTHYEIAGPPDGQSVVLVHGFCVPYHIWDPTFDALAQAGFRVLRYDLFGRGYSDRPDVTYDSDLFDRQLVSLVSALDVNLPLDVLGLSMGGAIAVVFTAQHPGMVRKLGLLDPVGIKSPLALKILRVPLLGEGIMSLFGDKALLSGLATDLVKPEQFSRYREQFLPQMKYRGFKRALLSTLRHGPFDVRQAYERVGRQNHPALLIWGRLDKTAPFETHEKVRQAIAHIEFHAIDEAGHIPHYERPEVVNPLLIDFLGKKS